MLRKIGRQMRKDYLVHPLLSGPSFFHTLAANAVANLIRNLWTHSVIMCGHFPEGVETFAKESIEGETRGEWYLRQMIGSANIEGSKAMHMMTGNLSHQIEHHSSPTCRATATPRSRRRCGTSASATGCSYTTGTLPAPGRLRLEAGHPAVAAQRLLTAADRSVGFEALAVGVASASGTRSRPT